MRIVVCAMAKNEHKYINEWVNHYLKLGFDKIYLYDNDDIDKPYIGDYITVKSRVKIIDVRGQKKEKLQQEIYTKFYNTYKKDFEWCLFCDIDEYLVGIKSVHEWLEKPIYRNAYQIRVMWKLFGDDNLIDRDRTKTLIETLVKPVSKSLNRNLIDIGNLEIQGKAIVRGDMENVLFGSPHFASFRKRDNVIPSILPSGKLCWSKVVIKEDYTRETIYLNHYMTKTLSEFVEQKLNRNDAVYNQSIPLSYYWRINEKNDEKINWLKEKGYI